MNQNVKNFVYGICFLIIGIGYLGDLGMLWNFSIFFPGWWTLAIMIPSVLDMFTKGFNFGNIFFFLTGLYLLLDINGWIHFEFNLQFVGAIACIGFGIWLIKKGVEGA